MNNPDLTPVVITDKRGRVTTVHRRAGVSTSETKMPPPYSPSARAAETLLEPFKPQAREACNAMKLNGTYRAVATPTLSCIALLDQDVFDGIVEKAQGSDREADLWKHSLSHRSPFNTRTPNKHPRIIEQYREALVLYPAALKILEAQKPIQDIPTGGLYNAVDNLIHLAEKYGEETDMSVENMRASMVATAIQCAYFPAANPARRKQQATPEIVAGVAFIRDNFDAVMERLPQLMQRGSCDPGLMREMLDTESVPLMEGVL